MKERSAKSHETTRKPNIAKNYFGGVVSCDLVDRSYVFCSKQLRPGD
jgi:hypothetical protein